MKVAENGSRNRLEGMAKKCFSVFIAIVCFIAASVAAHADDLGYRFFTNSVLVGDCGTSYSSYVASAVQDYNLNTHMQATYQGENCNSEVIYVEGNYGATGWTGNSVSVNSANQPCSWFTNTQLTGYCNTTNHKAFGATIFLNDYYPSFTNPNFEMRHELGHVFGMAHKTDCTVASVMHPFTGYCTYSPTSLQTYDISLMNSWY